MRIGINGFYLTTANTGLGQYTINLLHALAQIDSTNKYSIFVPQQVDFTFPPNFKYVIVPPLKIFSKTFLNRFIWEEYQLGQAIKKHNIELFHGMYQSLPRGSEHIANVVTIHDAIPWRFPYEREQFAYKWYSDIRKNLVSKRAKKVITISDTSKIDFAHTYDIKPETIEVTYESIDPVFWDTSSPAEVQAFKKEFTIEKNFILYTGGLKRHKNLRILIKSFDILVKEYGYKGDLYILGAVRDTMAISPHIYYKVEDLEHYADLKKIGDRVKFVGFVSRKQMSQFMQAADVFVSLSLYEGFGLPALEAMTSGCPCVLSNTGAYPEIADGAALLVLPYGPHKVAQTVNDILSDKALRETLVRKGKKRAAFFDRTTIAKRVLEIYQEVYDDYKINFQP